MSSQTPDDKVLIEQFLAGSEDSFEILIRRYETKVFNLADILIRYSVFIQQKNSK